MALGFAGSRDFPETLGRALTRHILAQFPAQPLVSGLCREGADAWCLSEALGLRIVPDDGTLWLGPGASSDPVWYASTMRVRLAANTPCITYEVHGYPYRGDLGTAGGPARNAEMAHAERAARWFLLWDGKSNGTRHMLDRLLSEGAHVEVYTPSTPAAPDLRVATFQRAGAAPLRVVYHGPKEAARVVTALSGDAPSTLDVYGRPWPEVAKQLKSDGWTLTGAPEPWTR